MAQFIDISWSDIKAKAAAKSLRIQFKEQSDYYLVWLQENVNVYRSKILITTPRNTDQIDFEDNYQSTANDTQSDKVGIFSPATGLTADVVDDGGVYKLAVTTDAATAGGVANNIFGEAIIAPTATTNVVSYTVPVAKSFKIKSISVGGAELGVFELQVDATIITRIRNSGSEPTQEQININEDVGAGSVITISVENIGDLSRTFEGTVFGEERDI